ncbi:E3 ubiquitin-protein ligase XIAP-like isoform X2 [Xyrauchen texanus]|uniref:E3 ubiquitin-protein ligase XIAP-like isoform X2 n=1 Tax=Xyrauchen texanus TaxID=154827 RepID=UPI002241D9A9|nr:E3 ubiquitin-protein ligase XIAP-like isoform X2 [Xyrauchen texanus]XP_052005210.1 E3 ubiquitin-protein ligase XIAP-like isoform X2 [Xyrauchen texanus]
MTEFPLPHFVAAVMAQSSDAVSWSVMKLRLISFQHFPRSQEVSAERLARAGFYYTGEADRVRCFSCNATVEDWKSGDAPLQRHQLASPACSFLSCAHGLNVLNDLSSDCAYNEEAESREFLLRTGEVVDETIYPNVPHMRSEEARLRTFSNWPANSPVQPCDLAEAGLYYLERDDIVQCFCCGGMLSGWERGDDAWGEHAKYYRNCSFILGHDVGNVPLSTPRPRVNGDRASLETFEGRLNSFSSRKHHIDHNRLARAGFYSTGDRDKVICFKCGGGVKDWMPDEDPWEEHARHYPGCSFLLEEKGKEYVSHVQLRYPIGQHSRSSQNGFSSQEGAKQSEIAQKAVEMGFDPIEVEKTILQKIRQNSEGYTSIEALIEDLSGQENDSDVPKKPEDPMKKLEKLQREKLCKVCMDSDIGIVFIPCGHLVTCQKCSDSLDKCPICFATITQKIKTYNA